MFLCKNCFQEFSQPQENEKGKKICPVKGCGADFPENIEWPKWLLDKADKKKSNQCDTIKTHYVISSPYNAGLFAGYIIFKGSIFECENYLQEHDDIHGRTGQPIFTIISANEWHEEFKRRCNN